MTIEVHDYETDQVHKVEWEWEDWQLDLLDGSRSIAKLYDNYARGAYVPTVEDAWKRHKQYEDWLSTWSA